MYIEKIHIDTFGKLADLDIEPSSGVNIIEGANESGKSTIAAFIKFVLYGVNSREREQLLSWRTGGAAGSLTVCAGEKRLRIERALAGSREAVQLIDSDTNMPIRHALDGTTPGEYLLGVDADMFSATAFVSQLGGTTAIGSKVTEGIENILFSADESINTKRALSKLDAARVAILHKNEKGGRLYELEHECAELEVRLADAIRVHNEIMEKEVQLNDSRAKYERAASRATTFSERVEQFELRLKLELYERRRAIEARIAELRAQIEKSGAQDIMELRAMERMNAKVTNLRHELEEVALREATEAVEEEDNPELDEYLEQGGRAALEAECDLCRTKSRVYTVVGVIALVLALAAFGLGLFPMITGGRLGVIPMIGGAALAAPALTMLLLGGRARRRASSIEEYYDFSALDAAAATRKSAQDAAKFAVLAAAEARRRYDEACEEVRRTYGCEEHRLEDKIAELNEKMRGADGIKAEYDKNVSLLSQIESQLQHYTEDELRAKVDETIDIADVDVANLPAMRREAEFAGKMAESLEKYISELEKTLAGLYPTAKDPIRLTDTLNARKAECAQLMKKHAAYVLAHDKLVEASASLRRSIAPRLANEAAAMMSHITDGKYSEVGIGADLGMSAETECGTKPLEVLSAGTQDAAYLSLRLALITLLYRKELPPMVFDEAFARQDDTRLLSLLELIRRRDEQSFIFTSNCRESKAMSELGGYKQITL